MGRASNRVKGIIGEAELSPILFFRILNVPRIDDPTDTESLYLTDCDYDPESKSRNEIDWFDEKGLAQKYVSCGISFEQVAVTTDNTIETSRIKLDNVNRQFSAMAQFFKLNGVAVQVLRGYRELLAYPDGAQLLFAGELKKVLINEYSLDAEVWSSFSLNVRIPRRLYDVGNFPYIPAAKDVRRVYRG